MTILEVKNLTVILDHQVVLENISFSLEGGDFVAIIGPNGAGKTTLFKAIIGLIHYEGEIHILNNQASVSKELIGYVPQHFHFDRALPLTVKEFLTISTQRPIDKLKISPVLQELDIHHLENKMLGKLSGGELQRVLVARAIFYEPKILLLDEPAAGIDIAGQKEFIETIKHLNKAHQTTILMITHDIAAIPHFANKILALNKNLIFFGDPKEFFELKLINKLYHRRDQTHIFHHYEHLD